MFLRRLIQLSKHIQPSKIHIRTTMSASVDQYLCDAHPPVCSLQIATPFAALTPKEKLYAHHLSQACWSGANIVAEQTSPKAAELLRFICSVFGTKDDARRLTDLKALKHSSGVTSDNWEHVLAYSAQVLSNLSNFRSFGATKFTPRASAAVFEHVVRASDRSEEAQILWDAVSRQVVG